MKHSVAALVMTTGLVCQAARGADDGQVTRVEPSAISRPLPDIAPGSTSRAVAIEDSGCCEGWRIDIISPITRKSPMSAQHRKQ